MMGAASSSDPIGDGPPTLSRMKGRGVFAWDNEFFAIGTGRSETGVHRALVHAVKDATNLGKYIPAVSKCLDWAEERRLALNSYAAKDAALAAYIKHLIYVKDVGVHESANLVSGFLHI